MNIVIVILKSNNISYDNFNLLDTYSPDLTVDHKTSTMVLVSLYELLEPSNNLILIF